MPWLGTLFQRLTAHQPKFKVLVLFLQSFLRWRRLIRYGLNCLIRPKAWLSYIRLRFHMIWSSDVPRINLECDDLFIVTSCTNPADNSKAVNHNAEHLQWQRGEELLATFVSIRRNYPAAIIVNLENSRIESALESRIQGHCDQWRNYSTDPLVRESRTFGNKGIPWLIKIIKFMYEEGENIHATRIHLLAGRYVLTGNTLARWQQPGVIFRYYPQHKNVSTRYFGYHLVRVEEIRAALLGSLFPMIISYSVEDVIYTQGRFLKYYLSHIGVRGMVNGKQFISE